MALLLSTVSPVGSATGGESMLVLDASGSMLGRLQGKTKMDTAVGAVDSMLRHWPAGESLGLIAYGHRRKGDCTDIEILQPVAALDSAAVRQRVKSLHPKGMTPISAAVRLAAEQLRYTERKATVILVSDGEETCDADPCALGSELEQAGVDFTAHVVGFDLPQGKARAQLQCLATRTGGRYVEAGDAASLTRALDELATAVPGPGVAVKAAEPWIPGFALEWVAGAVAEDVEATQGTRALEFQVQQTARDCQRECEQDAQCAGWHYEPTGSYFIDYPRCHLKGQGFPMRLVAQDQGWVAGVKPGARLIASDESVE